MQNLKILNSREKKEIYSKLKQEYGFSEKLEGVLMLSSKNKLFYLAEGLDILESNTDKLLRIDRTGLYIATLERGGLRFSVEGSQMLGPKCHKKILIIDDAQLESWVKGSDFHLNNKDDVKEDGFHILKFNDDFVGCALIKEGIVRNYLTKTRWLKNINF